MTRVAAHFGSAVSLHLVKRLLTLVALIGLVAFAAKKLQDS